MSTLLAPLTCVCGEPLVLLDERFDDESRVFVGTLKCAKGHQWLDQRLMKEPRAHPIAPRPEGPQACAIAWCGALAITGRYCPVHTADIAWKPGRRSPVLSAKRSTPAQRRGLPKGPQPVRLPFEGTP